MVHIIKLQKYWADTLLIILLVMLPALFFWRVITPNPADKMQIVAGDFTEQYFPLRAFSAQSWVAGQIPLWNPYLYGGQPALADIQSGALYPPHVVEALILGWGWEVGFPLWALELQVIAHFSLAAVGMFLFVRHIWWQSGLSLRRARFAGLISSLVFSYGGYMTSFPVQQVTILEVAAWLPWLLWAVSMQNRWGRLLGAFVFAMAILAGHPQTVLYIFYLSLAYTVFLAFHTGEKYRRLVHWFVIMALGGAISATQLLPTLEFISYSLRADLSYQAVSAGLPLNEFISILYPGFFGGSPEYVGIVSLVFIALALLLGRTNVLLLFWAGVGLVSLFLAFGSNTFLYPLFYLLLPGFEAVRQQERVFLLYSFSAAILAGYGAMALTVPFTRHVRERYNHFEHVFRVVVKLSFVLTGFFIYGSVIASERGDGVNLFYGLLRHHIFILVILGGTAILLQLRSRRLLRRTWGMGLIAVWIAFNLFTINWRFNLEKPTVLAPFAANGVTRFLQAETTGRIVSGGLFADGNSAASVYNLQDLTGNTPLQITSVATFFQQMPSWRMWQLMNVHYVLDNRDISNDGLTLVFEEGDIKIFKVGDPFPKAWFVSKTEMIADNEQAIKRLANDNFNLRQTAITAEFIPLALANSSSTVTVVDFTPIHLKAETETSGIALLLISQIYYPGWQATIDGQPADMKRVNVVQQGIVVPAGIHIIELTFSPNSFWWGSVISVSALFVWLVMFLANTMSKTRQNARSVAESLPDF